MLKTIFRFFAIFFVFSTLQLISSNSVAARFYVDAASGKDSNDCRASSRPCKSIQSAVNKIKAHQGTGSLPDSRLIIRGNEYGSSKFREYRESVTIDGLRGSAEKPFRIYVQYADGRKYERAGLRPSSGIALTIKNSSHLTVEGLNVLSSPKDGVAISKIENLYIRNMGISNTAGIGMKAESSKKFRLYGINIQLTSKEGMKLVEHTEALIKGVSVRDTVLEGIEGSYIDRSTFENVTVYNAGDFGWTFYVSNDNKIIGTNRVSHSARSGFYVWGSARNLFSNLTTFYNNGPGVGSRRGFERRANKGCTGNPLPASCTREMLNNTFDRITSYDNYDVKNHEGKDLYPSREDGEGADGIAISDGRGNVISNCVVYNNSDDGVDIWETTNTKVIGCVSKANGYGSAGDGQGYKPAASTNTNSGNSFTNNFACQNMVYGYDFSVKTGLDIRSSNKDWANGRRTGQPVTFLSSQPIECSRISINSAARNYMDRIRLIESMSKNPNFQ